MKNNKGFTLIEIMIGILIFSMVSIGAFQALSAVTFGKFRLIQDTKIEKESIYFTEKFYEMIKAGGTIDYEEYFNRSIVNSSSGANFSSGHYRKETGVGNYGEAGDVGTTTYGSNYYYCLSQDGTPIGTGGCVENFNTGSLGVDQDYSGEPQRYGQYALQFIDYNSNADGDGGDEDGVDGFLGDDDDEFIGIGPDAFTGGINMHELYLISGDKKTRTLFRWKIVDDPEHPDYVVASKSNGACDYSDASAPTGTGCLGTIEFLKLEGRDWGNDHTATSNIYDEGDGLVDTWIYAKDFDSSQGVAQNLEDKWQPLFPTSVHVQNFRVYPYPQSDLFLNWKSDNDQINIAPYVRIQFSLVPSWEIRKRLKMAPKVIDFSTTVALTDLFSK